MSNGSRKVRRTVQSLTRERGFERAHQQRVEQIRSWVARIVEGIEQFFR